MIQVATDYEGLRKAALEVFDEMFRAEDRERALALAADSANYDAVLDSVVPSRTLSPGYYERVAFLLDLEQAMGVVHYGPGDVTEAEVRGVAAVRAARDEFQRTHPPCANCGRRNEPMRPRCRNCNEPLKETR